MEESILKKIVPLLLLVFLSCSKEEEVLENFWDQYVNTSWISDSSVHLNSKYGESYLCLGVMNNATIYNGYEITGGRHVSCQIIEIQNKETTQGLSYFILQNDPRKFQLLVRRFEKVVGTTAESYITYTKMGSSIHLEIRNYQYENSKILQSKSFKTLLNRTNLTFEESMGNCLDD